MRPPQLQVRWSRGWRDFRETVRVLFLTLPMLPPQAALSAFSVDLLRGGGPRAALLVSALFHVLLLLTPLPDFLTRPAALPPAQATRVEYDLHWPGNATFLPPIEPVEPNETEQEDPGLQKEEPPATGAEVEQAQTVVSNPPEPNHPRQTLLSEFGLERARVRAPEIELPNMVIPPAPELEPDPGLALDLRQLRVSDSELPANLKSPGQLALERTRLENLYPKLARQPGEAGPAPDVEETAGAAGGEFTGPSVIALSAQPGPPRPVLELPEENLRARFSAGPAPGSRGGGGTAGGAGGLEAPDILVTLAGEAPAGPVVVGPVSSGPPAPAPPPPSAGRQQAEGKEPTKELAEQIESIDEEMAKKRAEQLLQGVEPGRRPGPGRAGQHVYTIYLNMPNLGSQSGSWVLRFAELGALSAAAAGGAAEMYPLEAPVAKKKVDPGYPARARREELEGTVFLYGIIRADGTVENIEVVRSAHELLDRRAVQAFKRWRFRPGRKNGQAVNLEVVVEIPFRLGKLF